MLVKIYDVIWHSLGHMELTHWGRDKMAASLTDDIFKYISSNENFCILNKIPLKYVTWGLIDNMAALVQIMVWHWQVTSHYLKQCWFVVLTHMHHLASMSFAVKFFCSCSAPSHYLKQRWSVVLTHMHHLASMSFAVKFFCSCSAPSHYLKQRGFVVLTHICITWPPWALLWNLLLLLLLKLSSCF